MHDDQKTKAELLQGLDSLRRRVSELEQVEKALKHSEKQFKELFENTVVGVYRTTPDGRIIMANPALVRMLGYSSFEELSRRNLEKGGFAPQYPRSIFKDLIEKEGKVVGLESAWLKRDGTTLFISENARAICDESGKTLYYEGVVQDITERKKAEEVLRESEQRYRDIFNGVTDAILILDLEDYIVDANPEACKMFGYSREEMIGLAAHRLVHSDYRRKLEEFRNDIETKGRIHFEAVNLRKDGTPLNVAVRGTMFAHNGKKHFLVTLRDITKRKRAEETWSKVNKCFLSFGPNPDDNIDKIVETAGFVLQSAWALYNKEEGALLCARAGWNIPDDFKREDTKVGRICFDVISRNRDESFVVNNLDKTHYAKSDANVVKYGLKTYAGCAVKTDSKAIGSLCVVYQEDKTVGSNELKILSILAKALGVEEERKRAAEMFRQYQFMVESAHDAIFFKDLESRYIIANDRTLEAFGLSREQVIGRNDYEIMTNKEEAWKNIEDDNLVFKTGKLTELTKHMTGTDGKERWFQAIKVPQFDNEGKIIGLIGVARDISERKKAEEALRESESKYRDLVEEMTDVIYTLDTEGNITSINEAGKATFGREPEEVLGKSFTKWIPQERSPGAIAVFKRILRGEKITSETVLLDKDGKPHNVEFASTRIIKDGKVLGTRGIIRDITERKKAEEQLRQNEEKYRLLFEGTSTNNVVLSVDGVYLMMNEKGAEHLGGKSEHFVGKSVYDTFPKDAADEYVRRFRHAAESGQTMTYEDLVELPKGNRWFLTNIWPIKDPDGNVTTVQLISQDITERKKAEEALQESEERLRVALSAAQMGTWRWDPVTNQDTRDASLNLILGLEAVESTQPVEDFLHFVHPEDRDMVDEEIQRAIHEGRTYLAEFRIMRPDGTVRWLRDQGKPLCDENGRVSCLTGAVVDITERKKAEEKIKLFLAAIAGSTDAIVITDMKGIITYVNPATEEMFGYEKGELIGQPVTVLTVKPEIAEEMLSNLIKTGSWNGEVLYQKKTKGEFPALLSLSLIRDEKRNPVATMGAARDITERKRAEEQIRRLSSAVEQSIDGIAVAIGTVEPRLVYVNDAFAGMHAYTPGDMIGMPLAKLHNKKQMREHKNSINQIKTHDSWEGEIGRIRRDGKPFTAYISLTLLKNDEGKSTGILVIARDISESKRREEELNIYRENMVQAEELAAVGTLSATLAHELTQPLTVIGLAIGNSLAELEKMSCPDTVVEDLKEGLSEISSITSMVERFRNFAKMSTKRTVSEVDFKAIAGRIVKLLGESAWRAKVTLRVEGMEKLPLIYSSERDLEQLFFSLIENAIQAADGKKKRRVIISGAVRDDHIELQFSDNCGGIARKNLDRIFKPFFTTKHGAGRTGLGLCVVERIVSQLGGKVRVESTLGKGSTFFVTLPMSRGER